MLFLEVYNHNVIIGKEIVGYINKEGIVYISNRRFATLTEDGRFLLEGSYEAGHITDGGDIILNNKNVGHITENNDIYFSPKALG